VVLATTLLALSGSLSCLFSTLHDCSATI
jgi:hypothetical protein